MIQTGDPEYHKIRDELKDIGYLFDSKEQEV